MTPRLNIAILLLGLGTILAFLPYNPSKTFRLQPDELLAMSLNDESYLSVDQVARFINNEDTSIQLIDLRTDAEFMECNIPGSINIPFNDLLNPDWEGYLNQKKVKNIFYSNDDQNASLAWTIVSGLGYENNFMMRGGMNEWFRTVMLSKFEGEHISARENVLFENRLKARRTFTQINSLPDSLKRQYLEAKRLEESQLDGGCE
ncbi:rhodanese-like domain-containing protein [Maribellus sp. YY47]|uniref:rhodanese-like domain-containing protein n=1 Tax=Maribellus sp. YY47 TaxID=2929486 RepID=UPI0020019EB4|nr:rhodanese-like domain-containing protein [Maribellus sp. YY47]MCK3683557.1 rhodanese-like domain-containing protein [Maribellus sp. YY47]